eukprot:9985599-Alexandrium_andersonii.AAC.1
MQSQPSSKFVPAKPMTSQDPQQQQSTTTKSKKRKGAPKAAAQVPPAPGADCDAGSATAGSQATTFADDVVNAVAYTLQHLDSNSWASAAVDSFTTQALQFAFFKSWQPSNAGPKDKP